MTKPLTLIEKVREVLRLKHMSLSTEASYVFYIRRFVRFHHDRHPREMGVPEIRAYLAHLAVEAKVAPSTQNVALSALLFLYREILRKDVGGRIDSVRAQRRREVFVGGECACSC